MVIKAFTLHNIMSSGRYGYEATHAYRDKVFKCLNILHTVVYTEIPNYEKANWIEDLEDKGILNFYHIILDLSDIARNKPSLRENDIIKKDEIKEIIYNKLGYIGQIIYKSGRREYYTTSLFLVIEDNNKFELYNSKGLFIKGFVSSNGSYTTSTNRTQIDYLLNYLLENSNKEDIFIMDIPILVEFYKLKRFFKYSNRSLYRVIHYNIFSIYSKYIPIDWGKILVASEPLNIILNKNGINSQFIPPVALENTLIKKIYDKVINWCLVGNNISLKRVEMAIEVFESLEDSYRNIKLTIFGEIPKNIKKLPKNIISAGVVSKISYSNYDGYISCSSTELFANSMVEASHCGLICLVSNVDFAHRYYKLQDDKVHLFNNKKELRESIIRFSKQKLESASFSNKYYIDNVINEYKKIFNIDY